MSEDPKDQQPDEQPRRSILVTLLIAATIALLAGFLAWGVPPRCLRLTRAMTRRTRSQPRAPSLSSKAQTSGPPQNETKGNSLCLT